jgi:hypothetical protein
LANDNTKTAPINHRPGHPLPGAALRLNNQTQGFFLKSAATHKTQGTVKTMKILL